MLTERELDLIDILRNTDPLELQDVLLKYVVDRERGDLDHKPQPYQADDRMRRPFSIGDRIRFVIQTGESSYSHGSGDVVVIADNGPRIGGAGARSYGISLQSIGVGPKNPDRATTPAPPPPKADGPTDTEMWDWLEANEVDLIDHPDTKSGHTVRWAVGCGRIVDGHPTYRSAVRAAMAKVGAI